MSTTMAKNETIQRKWYVIDAAGKSLGRTAALAASLLKGKHKVDYTPNADCGDYVIIINAEKAVLTGKKLTATKPELAMKLAVKGMLPKNSIGRWSLGRMKVYAGAEHMHNAQKPEFWTAE